MDCTPWVDEGLSIFTCYLCFAPLGPGLGKKGWTTWPGQCWPAHFKSFHRFMGWLSWSVTCKSKVSREALLEQSYKWSFVPCITYLSMHSWSAWVWLKPKKVGFPDFILSTYYPERLTSFTSLADWKLFCKHPRLEPPKENFQILPTSYRKLSAHLGPELRRSGGLLWLSGLGCIPSWWQSHDFYSSHKSHESHESCFPHISCVWTLEKTERFSDNFCQNR